MSYFCKKCTNLLKKVPLDPSDCNDTTIGMGLNTIDTTGKVNILVRCDKYDLNEVAKNINEVLETQTKDRISPTDMKTLSNGIIEISAEILDPTYTDPSDDLPQNYEDRKLYTMKIKGEWYIGKKRNELKFKLPDDFTRKNLYEQLSKFQQNEISVDEKIQTLLGKIRFYGVKDSDEGFMTKEIDFNTEQISNIKRNYLEFKEDGYDEDDSFVRAVIETMGMDKSGKPVVRLFSFDEQSNINIIPDITTIKESKGLATLLRESIIYFTVDKSSSSPDSRDVKIMKGNLLKAKMAEPKKDEPKQVEMREPQPQPKKEEPFEMVMREKEKKGLGSLLNTGKTDNNLTKRQKEIVEKLRKNGYKFSNPQNEEMYEMKNLRTSEFSEGIKVWKPKK
jgi:hypothetical protein